MIMHVKDARYFNDYKIEVSFNDGRKGVADLSNILGGIFEPLKDKSLFSKFNVDEELNTVTWSNVADIAPEYLYFLAFKDEPELAEKFKQWGYI
ncbi:MAG: DUF2442 domain-containing protein [Desulfamplus sp.]|nr:DUF2442 domain-containing protein [Desulfamplus sp.]MBF0391022.1 DUF2442 domain-containing protein [Desulfamplus sp.]